MISIETYANQAAEYLFTDGQALLAWLPILALAAWYFMVVGVMRLWRALRSPPPLQDSDVAYLLENDYPAWCERPAPRVWPELPKS